MAEKHRLRELTAVVESLKELCDAIRALRRAHKHLEDFHWGKHPCCGLDIFDLSRAPEWEGSHIYESYQALERIVKEAEDAAQKAMDEAIVIAYLGYEEWQKRTSEDGRKGQ